jgi:chromosome partitioning protein
MNALVASDGVIVPMETQFLCWEGYELLKNSIEMSKTLNPNIEIIGLLATKHKRNNHAKQVLEIMEETGLAFKTIIPDRVAFTDATVEGVPVSDIKDGKELGILYDELAQEVIDRGY